MSSEPSLRLSVGGSKELVLTRTALRALPAAEQVPDVGHYVEGKRGRAVWLAPLLARLGPDPAARYLNLASSEAGFAASVPLEELARGALVVYELDGEGLPAAKGGPFRLLVPGHADECVHIKALVSVELARERGRDTRPADDEEHRRLHQKKK